MSITEKTIVVFDPVRDYRTMTIWIGKHDMTEWKRRDSTAAISFEREQTIFVDAVPTIIEAEEGTEI